jgi:hypothetical protein
MVYNGLYITWLVIVDRVKEGGRALGGFNFILFWNFNRNQTENDRYWQKNYFLLFVKCLKMYSFFAFAFKVWKKCYYEL